MEEFKFIEPELIKAGSDKLRLGLMRYAPKVDCRVLSEDTYQELKKAYDLVCGGECSNENSGLNIPVVMPSNLKVKKCHADKCRVKDCSICKEYY